jgi:hypothetical protein
MKTHEFLRQIAEARDQFDWSLTADTGHYPERRATPRFHLDAITRSKPEDRLDPVRALAYVRTGEVPETWEEAAFALGLDLADASAIVAAANDRTWTGAEGQRQPEMALLGLRRSLLEAVGIVVSENEVFETILLSRA